MNALMNSTIAAPGTATGIYTLARAPDTIASCFIPTASTILTTPTSTQAAESTADSAALGTAFMQEVQRVTEGKLDEPIFVDYKGKTYKFEYPYQGASGSWSSRTSVGHVGTSRDIRSFKEGCNAQRRETIDKTGEDVSYENFTLTEYNGKHKPAPCAWMTRKATPKELAEYDAWSSGAGSVKVPLIISTFVKGVESLHMMLPAGGVDGLACASGLWPSACDSEQS